MSDAESGRSAIVGLTSEVADLVGSARLEDVPNQVLDAAKRSLLDGLGLAVAGSRTQAAHIARRLIAGYASTGQQASVLGTATKAPARFAAFLNGLAIHADDYDDTQLAVASDRVYGLLTHPTAPVLGATLAVAEERDLSGADLLLAYLIGVEVATKLAEAISPRHYDDGFHATATLGAIGASAGVSRVLGLDHLTTCRALGIAASQAGGVREHFGTMTKPFHAGRAAESGVVAGEIARLGFTAAENALEARRGFLNAAGGGYAEEAIHGKLANPWTFEFPGVSIKPYPSGSLTHPGMTAFSDLVLRENLKPEDVESITVGTNRHMPNALIHHRPTTELEAKFSMEFCIAILLLERRAGLTEFTDEVVNRPDVKQMIERVNFHEDAEAEAAGYNSMMTNIRVALRDGSLLTTTASFGRGSPQNPMPDSELVGKFSACLEASGFETAQGQQIADSILSLEDQPSISAVLKPLIRQ